MQVFQGILRGAKALPKGGHCWQVDGGDNQDEFLGAEAPPPLLPVTTR